MQPSLTTSRSGEVPDLAAATSADICGTAEAYAFDVTSIGDACGVLGPSPTTNPCAVTVDPTAASSISASATASACSPLQHQLNPNVTCPNSTRSTSSANIAAQPHMAAASTLLTLLATLTALVHLG